MEEKTFYKDDNVLVSTSRFVFSGRTFLISNLLSVSNSKVFKNDIRILAIVILLIGIFIIIVYQIFEIIIISISGILLFTIKDKYAVKITSNSGEENVMESRNKKYFQTIVDAINEAIVY